MTAAQAVGLVILAAMTAPLAYVAAAAALYAIATRHETKGFDECADEAMAVANDSRPMYDTLAEFLAPELIAEVESYLAGGAS